MTTKQMLQSATMVLLVNKVAHWSASTAQEGDNTHGCRGSLQMLPTSITVGRGLSLLAAASHRVRVRSHLGFYPRLVVGGRGRIMSRLKPTFDTRELVVAVTLPDVSWVLHTLASAPTLLARTHNHVIARSSTFYVLKPQR